MPDQPQRNPAEREKPDLAALLGSRICHDLISPIGAISNGVELLIMDGQVKGPEIALISESVSAANARIRFFRVAYGAAAGDHRIGRPEVLSVLSDVTNGGRLVIDWQSGTDLSRREVKLAFLLIQCLESAMPYGGRVTVTAASDHWTLQAQTRKLRISPELWEVLSNPAATAEIGPSQVHFLLAADEARRQTRQITADIREEEVRMTF